MERLLFEFATRSTLIAAATGVVLALLRIRSAAARHAAWAGVTLAMLLLPVWMAWGPKASLPVLPARPAMVMDAAPQGLPTAVDQGPAWTEASLAPATKRWEWDWSEVLAGVYALGAFALLLRLAMGTIRARRLTSADCSAPVTVGLFRPRIILPESADEWSQAQLDAVMTHEREHARRRDPLFQWLALFNRAVFWFHPLAWWLEQRLGALAEEACDVAVIESGHDPQEYSMCLLEMARAVERAGTRVNVVAMAMPGNYLPSRIRKIVSGVRVPRISRARLACAALACSIPGGLLVAGTLGRVPEALPLWPLPARQVPEPPPILLAQATSPTSAVAPQHDLKFEVASVRAVDPVAPNTRGGFSFSGGPGTKDPERIRYTQAPLFQILARAFRMQADQIIGPDWVTQPYAAERFEMIANVPPGATQEQVSSMMQNLLKERFRLAYHMGKRDLDGYELVVAKGGPKLKDADTSGEPYAATPGVPAKTYIHMGDDGYPNPPVGYGEAIGVSETGSMNAYLPVKTGGAFRLTPPNGFLGALSAVGLVIWRFGIRGVTVPEFAGWLQELTGFPHLADRTGLRGTYDIKLRVSNGGSAGNGEASDPAPDIFEALEKELGLKLQKIKAPFDVMVIDHIDKTPVEN
jgi:uncharacterized protein (TIGR03435 family)